MIDSIVWGGREGVGRKIYSDIQYPGWLAGCVIMMTDCGILITALLRLPQLKVIIYYTARPRHGQRRLARSGQKSIYHGMDWSS